MWGPPSGSARRFGRTAGTLRRDPATMPRIRPACGEITGACVMEQARHRWASCTSGICVLLCVLQWRRGARVSAPSRSPTVRLGIDIGGTFTDIVLLDDATG